MGSTLRNYRISLNMTKAELARKAHISKYYITKLERNLSVPSPPILRRISLVLNVCPHVLIDICNNCPFETNCEKKF